MRKFKIVKCPECTRTFKKVNSWCNHMKTKHADKIPEGFTPLQYLYGVITGRYEGNCMYCNAKTEWNESTGKYGKLCGKPECREKYAKQHQLLSPDKQREMLSKRQISKIYEYGPSKVKMQYTGTYELRFLTFLDNVLEWPATDIMAPSPNTYYYDYKNPEDPYHEGKKFYIPDFYIPSLNLEIEIKDSTTTHPKFLKIDKVKEACKDKKMNELRNTVNYIKINDNNFTPFIDKLDELKMTFEDKEIRVSRRSATESFILNSAPIVPYSFPMSYENLVKFWGKKKADEILKDPSKISTLREGFESVMGMDIDDYVHEVSLSEKLDRWTAETGILIIRPCDRLEQLTKLYIDWLAMDIDDQKISDDKSYEVFGMSNIAHYHLLVKFSGMTDTTALMTPSMEGAVKDYVMDKINALFSFSDLMKEKIKEAAFIDESDMVNFAKTSLEHIITTIKIHTIHIIAYNLHKELKEIEHKFLVLYDGLIEVPIIFDPILSVAPYQVAASQSKIDPWALANICNTYQIDVLDIESAEVKIENDIYSIDLTETEEFGIAHLNGVYPLTDENTIFEAVNQIASESVEDINTPILLPAMESASAIPNMIQLDHSWYQKMFVGSIITMHQNSPTNLGRTPIVTIKDGYIYIKNIMAYTLFNRMGKYYQTKNIKNIFLIEYNEKSLIKYYKKKISRSQLKIQQIYAPEFFALELVEIFNDLGAEYRDKGYLNIAREIYDNTWLSTSDKANESTGLVSLDRLSNLNLELLPYQKEFVTQYNKLKAGLHLNGYVLAFEQGLGKTVTATALAECIGFDHVYIVCPNTLTINWALELRKYYKKYQEDETLWREEVILCKDKKPAKNGKFFIVNQESIKLMKPYVRSGKNMLIVDESHNFRNISGKRTLELIEIRDMIQSTDNLMLSGTPIKAIPNEIAPILRLIDPTFTDEVAQLYVKAFNINNTMAASMINKRFGQIMYRKDKSELTLPDKKIEEFYCSLSNPKPYLFNTVIGEFKTLFSEIYKEKMKENQSLMDEFKKIVKRYSSTTPDRTEMYCKWLSTVNTTKTMKLHDSEVDIILEFLPNYVYPNIKNPDILMQAKELEMKFIHMKNSAMGIAMGQILPPARRQAFIDLWDYNEDLFISKIAESTKKTVIFSQFKPVVNHIVERLNANNISAVKVTGDNVGERMSNIMRFKDDDTCRVIVATSATMGTGVTLTEANQMFFFGPPWRDADFQQCCDRIHRIGQTEDVHIYVVLLESGTDLNVTTRMSDIMKWSQEMFDSAISVTEADTTDPIEDTAIQLDKLEAMESYINEDYMDYAYESLFLSNAIFRHLDMLKPLKGYNRLYVISPSKEWTEQLSILNQFNKKVFVNMDELITGCSNDSIWNDYLKKSISNYIEKSKRYKAWCIATKLNAPLPANHLGFEIQILDAIDKYTDMYPDTIFVFYGMSFADMLINHILNSPFVIEDFSLVKSLFTSMKDSSSFPFMQSLMERYKLIKHVISTTKEANIRPILISDLQKKITNFYHLSENPNLTKLSPRIPSSTMVTENKGTRRSCVATDIDGCLAAVPYDRIMNRNLLYVYRALVTDDTIICKPNAKLVPDQDDTNEHWILNDVNLELESLLYITRVLANKITKSNNKIPIAYKYAVIPNTSEYRDIIKAIQKDPKDKRFIKEILKSLPSDLIKIYDNTFDNRYIKNQRDFDDDFDIEDDE